MIFKNDIEHFFWAFREYLKFIDEKCQERFEGRLLICVYLDSLSGYKYGRMMIRNRFKSFVLNYSKMKDIFSLISLPLLKEWIIKEFPEQSDIKDIFTTKLNMPDPNDILKWEYPNIDVNIIKLSNILYNELPYDIFIRIMKQAYDFQYVNILYERYRCMPIHEARLSDEEAPNLNKRINPYYTVISPTNNNMALLPKVVWFGLPFIFLRKTLKNCIDSFESECIKNDINPFEALD
jgi:hypothetical protein